MTLTWDFGVSSLLGLSSISIRTTPKVTTHSVIFVHGLNGDREKTWTADDASILNARILTFGYDSNVTDWRGMVSKNRIGHHSMNMLTAIATYRESDDTNDRPLIFICHSLGGLVCEDALIAAQQRPESHLRSVLESTRGIIFLGTPHHGSALAQWAEKLAKLLNLIKETNPDIVAVLKSDSEVLARIQDSFHTMIRARNINGLPPIEITCFFEELPLSGVGLVVPSNSAVLPGYIPIGIRGNHMNMTKFENLDDPGFIAIVGELRRWIKALSRAQEVEAAKQQSQQQRGQQDGEQCESIPAVDHHQGYWYPNRRVNHFIAREEPLREIDATYEHSSVEDAAVVILFGMGGSGKTQLALEYCQRTKASGRFTSIFWVDASNLASIAQGFAAIAGIISETNVELANAEASIQLVTDTISRWQTPWLIVFDNFDQPSAFKGRNMKDYFPRGKKGAILLTSRNAGAQRLGHMITVTSMSPSEGLNLLLQRSKSKDTEENNLVGTEIVHRLGCLALAIDQAGAYISARGLALNLYLDHYNHRREIVWKETPELWDYRRKLSDTETETSLSVFTTWEMSFEQINGDGNSRRSKEHLLTICAFFNNKDIFEGLFLTYFKLESPEWLKIFGTKGTWDTFDFQDVLSELSNLSLLQSLQTKAVGAYFSLHPLIQDWMKLRLNSQDRQRYAMEAISMLDVFIRNRGSIKLTVELKRTIVSHLDASIQNDPSSLEDGLGTQYLMDTASSFASFYKEQGRYAEAEQLYGQSLQEKENHLGSEHPSTLGTVENLAMVYRKQGRYDEAEKLYKRALVGNETQLGPEHPETLWTLGNLAIVYRKQGRYKEAEELYGRVLAGNEEQLGPEHYNTLRTLQNLANVYREQGRYNEAEQLFKRVLAENEKCLTPEHPDTLWTLGNLAIVYRKQGRYEEAEKLYGRVLVGNEKHLGPDHPSTLRNVLNLANVYSDQGRYTEAEELYRRSLLGREKQLGLEHPSTLATVESFADAYKKQGCYIKAEQLYKRALIGNKKQLGPSHPNTLRTMKNLASIKGLKRAPC
ncbi:hypothetical protein VE04_08704 [Pseudogymnoascus sp. 24MN13]|nr:hypothetical protein VE04_08704 [Pseudogymnoascus sp. 24MN13]